MKLLNKMFRKNRRKFQKLGYTGTILIIIATAFMGTVFTVGMQYWNKTIEYDDCKKIETQYVDYEEIKGSLATDKFKTKEIAVGCVDGERYFIDGSCITAELITNLSGLHSGESITLLLHPNSDAITEIRTQDKVIMEFNATIEDLGIERIGFFILGIFLYICSIVFVLALVYLISINKEFKNKLKNEKLTDREIDNLF